MIAVDQTLFGEGVGNCFAACVASILEIPLVHVPNFCCDYPEDRWYAELAKWLNARGCMPLCIGTPDASRADHLKMQRDLGGGVPWVGSGPNPDGVLHSTVWIGDEMVHDPNPRRRGITRLDDAIYIVPTHPGRCS